MIYLAELGERIRLFRRKKGMTQRALAERLHVSTQAISSWELGVSYPDIENLCRLSEVLSVSVDALLVKGDTKEETYMIGIDGGGTKSEYALFSPSGQVKRTFCLSGTNAATKGVDEAVNILCRGIDICMDASVSVSHIFLGNAGSHYEELRRALMKRYPSVEIFVTTDAVCAFECVEEADAAMILGTGSVLLRPEGEEFRIFGGWGYKLGDPGSAYNFGREVLRDALAYEQGLHSDSMIYSLIRERAECDSILRFDRTTPAKVAALARLLFDAEEEGNAKAAEIIDREMRDLAVLVRATCPKGGRVVAVGGIVEHYGDRLLPVLSRYVGEDVSFVRATLPPIFGACRACMKRSDTAFEEGFADRFAKSYRALTEKR